jgi:DNA-binding transcriptional ArsR family regulator
MELRDQLPAICVGVSLPSVATYVVDPWTALGDPTRRAVFARVAQHPRAVGEIARELPVSRPAVSQHLRILKDAGLVSDRRDGNRRIYAARRDGLAALRTELDQFWNDTLANFKALVDQANQEDQ